VPESRPYMYIWEYVVPPDKLAAFERLYGASGGAWVQLFRRAPGYLRTELHRDRARPDRYLTIDWWASREAWDDFRVRFADEFADLDARGEACTASEQELGKFEPVA
jgi:heme-degrading monooxygenase HmoA